MRSNLVRAAALLVALSLGAAACSSSDSSTEGAAASGSGPSLAFTAPDLSGEDFDAASLEGQPAVLWFWAPWCTVCRAEAPDVVAAAAAFDGEVEVIGVAGRGEVDEMVGFVDDTGTGGLRHLVDGDGSIWTSFEVVSQPAFAFVGAGGEIEVVSGALGEDGLTERMEALLVA